MAGTEVEKFLMDAESDIDWYFGREVAEYVRKKLRKAVSLQQREINRLTRELVELKTAMPPKQG